MAWHALFLLLAGGQAQDADSPPPKLVCRYETTISRLMLRRKLCLTEPEWERRDRDNDEVSRKSLYELMGNTACANGGLCTSYRVPLSSDGTAP